MPRPQLAIERFNIYKTEVEACGRKFDPMDVAVCRAFYVAKNAEDKAKAIEARLANQTRLAKLAQTPDGNSKSSMLSFDQTLDAAAESAMFGTPDEIAEKLSTAARGRCRARAAQRSGRLAREPPRLRPRRHAGVRRIGSGPAPAAPAAARELVVHKPVPRAFGGIPPLIKRNTVLFALSQSFVGAGTQLAYGIGPLMVIAVTGSASLAGLTVGLFGISRFWCPIRSARSPTLMAASPASCSGRAWR